MNKTINTGTFYALRITHHFLRIMLICRVVGDVVSTIKNEHLKGHKLLLVQPVDLDGQTPQGEALIAVDKVDAGPQDLVLVNREGGAARILLGNPRIPVQAVIVGVIDNIDVAR